ncbi:MAG: SANT/Myb domain-containing protein [Holosporales bacterium]|nr:SANT/Myb domain-containing protein [Holosporales bacterium]
MPEQGEGKIGGLVKHKFTTQEDAILVGIVAECGESDWKLVAQWHNEVLAELYPGQFQGRSARQCRERWKNYLNPQLDSVSFTPEEDAFILLQCGGGRPRQLNGIASSMHKGRNAVRNRCDCLRRRDAKAAGGVRTKGHAPGSASPAQCISIDAPSLGSFQQVESDVPECTSPVQPGGTSHWGSLLQPDVSDPDVPSEPVLGGMPAFPWRLPIERPRLDGTDPDIWDNIEWR